MELQERLTELSKYNVSFSVADGKFVIRLQYHRDWTVVQPTDGVIQMFRDEANDTVFYYVAPITTDISEIFAAISETIDYNKELEAKELLFKVKIEELQELFVTESIDTLQTLEFKVKRKKAKVARKAVTEEAAVETDGNQDEAIPAESEGQDENISKKLDNEQLSGIDKKIAEAMNNKKKNKK